MQPGFTSDDVFPVIHSMRDREIIMSNDRQSRPSGRRDRLFQTVRKLMGAGAGCVLLLGAGHAHAAAAVTDNVVSQSAQTQNNVPVTFGQVFKDGDVPRNATVTASLDGEPIPLQVDAKAFNPDGSLRHAVLTMIVPSLGGKTRLPVKLTAEPALPAGDRPITTSQLLTTSYDAWVSLKIGGKTYTANARALLQAADRDNACAPWALQCNLWLSGPLASEWVVNGPVTAADGTTDPNLRVSFAVRAYAGATPGAVGHVRTDIIVENTSAFTPQAQPRYTAALISGTATYTSPALTQYAYTRWHKALWWNNAQPQVYLQQDTQYIQASKAISRYMPLQPDESFLAGLRQSCAPLDQCDQTKKMGNTGAQAAIGPLPRWTSVYIVDPDVRAYNWMLANTDALGAYSTHYRDQQTGWPVSIQKHPYATIIDWAWANRVSAQSSVKGASYRADLLPNCFNNSVVRSCTPGSYGTGNPNAWDNAHQPSGAFVPYMVTGDYYYMSELAFDASYNEIWSNEAYRGFSKGLIEDAHTQVRGKAWVLREMADAAWLLPNVHPLKGEFTADVQNSLADWNAKYTHNLKANPLGLMISGASYDVNGGHYNGMAPWMHNFFTWSTNHAAELGFAGAEEFRNWLAKFEIGLMTDWQSSSGRGYCWLQASAYSVQVKDSSGNWLPSYADVYGDTFPTLSGLECNSPAMLAELGRLTKHRVQAGEMQGYPSSATGFPANFQIGVAAAANSGLPNAQAAWDLFDSRSVKPSGTHAYNNYPNFAVVPRSAAQPPDTPPTPVNPPPVKPAQVWQTLGTDQKVVTVGDTFTVSGTLHYASGMTKPVTAYRLHGFDKKILSSPHGWTPRFVAAMVGTTQIKNDNSGVTGVLTITVVPVGKQPPVKPTLVGQTFTASKKVVDVGETFTVSGTLNYSDGTSKPVTAYRLYGFNKKILSSPHGWTPQFVATRAGTTQIKNDNSGVTGRLNMTVLEPH
ncbi:MAG: hypothetical protein ABI767_05005 [Rhodanobacter sp.]